ncbi:hypothetical protein ALI22I_11020 [Saccharothrix sp. ALI-22-I]|uniref:class I SAM-dependent methyltransferase n=1 Tax=Saccharothrix sp. ALI-22-I TaxID=1933778 RepID=UPI00097BCB5B|nr:class I SAM-dependent methyltransferase [Saccharothrix sp. ALI-22-I]ONI90950.1 hypothetical protein ALI22I_11020 [Saccharothrix sp. ALI-22-I]
MSTFLDSCHRRLFALPSRSSPAKQGRLLRLWFEWWHRRPDPWGLAVDNYEQHHYSTMLDHLPEQPYRRMLDVGCSEGVFTDQLAARHPQAEVVGVDISQRATDRARAGGVSGSGKRPRYLRLDVVSDDLDDRYDVVICAEMLYYLGRPERVRQSCRRLSRLLAPGGVLVVAHPWSEARQLHADLDGNPALRHLHEHVDRTSWRPLAVTLYERPTAPVVDAVMHP